MISDSCFRPQILVADDDPVSLRFLASALIELGCDVTAAASGQAAVEACRTQQFDLLLLDRRMPDLGGASLLRALRERGDATPAIATSAEFDSSMRKHLAGAGYADTLTKPVDLASLAALIADHCRLPAATREAAQAPPASAKANARDSVLLDDRAALASVGGDRQTLQALRGLFAKDLAATIERFATMPRRDLSDWLHRLRASCTYCGAIRLGLVAERVEAALANSSPAAHIDLCELRITCNDTLSALASTDAEPRSEAC